MSTLDLGARLGLFVVKEFLEAADCAQIRAELQASESKRAGIVREGHGTVDERIRRTRTVRANENTVESVSARLLTLMPHLATHFGLSLSTVERPQFLAYQVGDFFRPHRDIAEGQHDGVEGKRRVTAVIFLNGSGDRSQSTYDGGRLTFYDLVDDPVWKQYGFSLQGEEGALVAFRSETVHAVTPVTAGERYTITSWFV